jgi:predicted ABC-type sugar transport system permease subunit
VAAAADGVTLAHKGLGGVPTWVIVAISVVVVVWMLVTAVRRNRSR